MKTVVPTTLDIARESGWSGENEPKDFVGALKLLSDHIGPASPEAVAEAVDDWLDGHPEALVADGSVTTEKLADGAVTEEKLGVDLGNAPERVAELQGNQLTGELSGIIDTAADAYAAPPVALTVDGASTQAVTPTPDAPVPILSVDDLSLEVRGKNVFDSSILLSASYSSFDGEYYKVSGYWLNRAFPLDNDGYPVPIYGKQATLSFDGFNANGENYAGLNFVFLYTDNTRDVVRVNTGTLSHYSLTSNPSKTLKALGFSYNSNYDAKLKNIQLELGSTATAYEPYAGTTIPDLLPEDTNLRSLPDGTLDTLNLSYLRPSTRAGWAWYSRELVQAVGHKVASEFDAFLRVSAVTGAAKCASFRVNIDSDAINALGHCSHAKWIVSSSSTYNYSRIAEAWVSYDDSNHLDIGIDPSLNTLALGNAWLAENGPITWDYHLATPVTTTLDPIELPFLPAPTATVWCDGGSAQPSYTMQYVRDTNIVIAELREALADLATS